MQNLKWNVRNLFFRCSNIRNKDVIVYRNGLKNGVKNDIFGVK